MRSWSLVLRSGACDQTSLHPQRGRRESERCRAGERVVAVPRSAQFRASVTRLPGSRRRRRSGREVPVRSSGPSQARGQGERRRARHRSFRRSARHRRSPRVGGLGDEEQGHRFVRVRVGGQTPRCERCRRATRRRFHARSGRSTRSRGRRRMCPRRRRPRPRACCNAGRGSASPPRCGGGRRRRRLRRWRGLPRSARRRGPCRRSAHQVLLAHPPKRDITAHDSQGLRVARPARHRAIRLEERESVTVTR